MKSTVETLSPTRVRLAIEVPFAELEPSLKKAYREIGAQVQHPRLPQGQGAGRGDRPAGRAAARSSTRRCRRPSRSRSWPPSASTRCKTLGRPAVEITEFADGAAAEVHRRGRRPARRSRCPDLATHRGDRRRDRGRRRARSTSRSTGCAQRFATLKTVERAAAARATSSRSTWPRPSTARRCRAARRPTSRTRSAATSCCPAWTRRSSGMAAGEATTFTTAAGRRRLRRPRRRRRGDRPHGQGAASCPPLDDEFAQLASEFDTLDELRDDLRERLGRVKRVEQLYAARDKALERAGRGRRRAGAGGRRRARRSSSRKQAMTDQLERMGATLEDYLAAEEQDRGADSTPS